jgi:hypothetical protein
MGSFIIRPTVLSQGGTPVLSIFDPAPAAYAGWIVSIEGGTVFGAVTDPTNVQTLQSSVYAAGSGNSLAQTVRFSTTPNPSIYLDGSLTPIDYQHLPSGFIPTSAVVKVDGFSSATTGTGVAHFYLQQDSGNDGTVNTASYPYATIPPMFNILFNGMGFRVNITTSAGGDTAGNVFSNLRVEGTYAIVKFIATLNPANLLTSVGDPITISSGGPGSSNGMDLSHITVTVFYRDSSNNPFTVSVSPTSQSPTQYVFNAPNFDGAVQISINVVGDGTQFTGSVPLGSLPTINFTDGTGIYVLTPGKTFDSLYAQGTNPIQIVSMAIPNPFVKTGFIP